MASIALDGFQATDNQYTVKGQKQYYKDNNLPEKKDGWYVVSGKVDKASYGLLVFFVLCIAGLWLVEKLI